MGRYHWHIISGCLFLLLVGCNSQNIDPPNNPPMTSQPPFHGTQAIPSATSTSISSGILDSPPLSSSFPFSEPGPYFVGKHTYTIRDESRNGREILIAIYFPAIKRINADGRPIIQDAEADRSASPYPLILTGCNSGSYLFGYHLGTYGFVMVTICSPDFSYSAPWNDTVINGPIDFLFALEVLSSDPPEGLKEILDTDRVGVAGYSSDGLFSLAVSGARINPEYYFSRCAQATNLDPPLQPFLIQYYCNLSKSWEEFESHIRADITKQSGGLWQPTTDPRILAAMPMAPDSAWLYGPEGLADIQIPSLIIAGTDDTLVSYKMTSSYIYDHLVSSGKVLISFIGKGHTMVENKEVVGRINHFAVAFFGYYLQSRTDYAEYFSEAFVAQFDDLAWGIYEGE